MAIFLYISVFSLYVIEAAFEHSSRPLNILQKCLRWKPSFLLPVFCQNALLCDQPLGVPALDSLLPVIFGICVGQHRLLSSTIQWFIVQLHLKITSSSHYVHYICCTSDVPRFSAFSHCFQFSFSGVFFLNSGPSKFSSTKSSSCTVA